MRHQQIVGYVVSGPQGHYDYAVATLAEAWDAFDREMADASGGWAIGVEYANGNITFDRCPARPPKAA